MRSTFHLWPSIRIHDPLGLDDATTWSPQTNAKTWLRTCCSKSRDSPSGGFGGQKCGLSCFLANIQRLGDHVMPNLENAEAASPASHHLLDPTFRSEEVHPISAVEQDYWGACLQEERKLRFRSSRDYPAQLKGLTGTARDQWRKYRRRQENPVFAGII